jgi:hypothetical protein
MDNCYTHGVVLSGDGEFFWGEELMVPGIGSLLRATRLCRKLSLRYGRCFAAVRDGSLAAHACSFMAKCNPIWRKTEPWL